MPAELMPSDWPVRPLRRTRRSDGSRYTREPRVEAQVRALASLPEVARRRRLVSEADDVENGAAEFEGRTREETLVYFLREYLRRGDEDAAWRIAERLTERVSGHIRRELARWRLGPDEADECARDLFACVFEALFDDGEAAEFWEVRFWVCLDRRLWNLAEKRQQALDVERSGSATPDDAESGGEQADPLALLADTRPGPEALAEHADALAVLAENERVALFLRYVEGWPEESADPDQPSIARALGVTGRSVRNYLRRAEAKLRAWQQDDVK
jgi:DNA-directed RNA polymerase specialized sigma24 family protein